MRSTDPERRGTREGPEELRLQGHWLLAKLGKRVLRPGGMELTHRLVRSAAPASTDRIVEFGPGVGATAHLLLAANPIDYIAVDPNPHGTPQVQALLDQHEQARLVVAEAQDTGLPDGSADLVVGEAMLSMQSADDKLTIMREAYRILAPGGRYAIHELGVRPADAGADVEARVARSLSPTIKVGARPLTPPSWIALLEQAGFTIEASHTNPMRLLEPSRIFADEGFARALRFFWNVLRNPAARKRVRQMRTNFRANEANLNAVAFVARKPAQ